MVKFMFVTFLALGLMFYELSGGSDFVPQDPIVIAQTSNSPATTVDQTTDVAVSRSNAASLIALNPTVTPVSIEIPTPIAQPVAAITTAATETVIAAEPAPIVETTPANIRAVAGSRVNMRQGPGTSFAVLATLDGGTPAEVLEISTNGWARIEVVTTGQTGWMAERLLTDG